MAKKTKEKVDFLPIETVEPEKPSFKMTPSSDEQVSIIIVHRDKPAYLNMALQSIAVTSLNSNYEIIIVDNCSETQDAQDYLKDLETQDCKVIKCKENFWWSKAANIGAKAASKDSKYMIFLHHDVVILNPGWIDMLINVSESQDAGVVGVSMDSYEMDDINGKRTDVDFIEEWCMLITKECWQDCGPFSEKLEQVGAAFLYTMSAQWHNHKPQVIRNPLVHHYGVFAMDINDYNRFRKKAGSLIPELMRDIQTKLTRAE